MLKEKFLTELRAQLRDAFQAAKAGKPVSAADKHRCEGFMQAGEFLGLVTDDELAALINSVHVSVYGQSILEKRMAQQGMRLH
ncbi:MAG: hypothetical protein WAQ53_13400 [Thiofilum sp.]|uniref:hypothetical protein n=1 Tax=Thiofilum sp. TaxID=2212733 RepID=UPI0025E36C91|nr:hypothetical protein [Thiofilum sp.]MBK8454162.1 hypothetical protein [Thiofilum sp.]